MLLKKLFAVKLEKQTNRLMDSERGKEKVRFMERVTWKHIQFISVQSLSRPRLFATP